MTQVRYFDYSTPQTGWTDAQQFLGVLQPGRYKGFDAITAVNGTTISVTHSNSRALISPNIAQANSNNTGVWLTNQGVVIKEDATISGLSNASMDNTGGANKRIFAVYGQHQYAALPGGTVASYGIKAGGTDGSYPVLDIPKTQVPLLYIHIPAGQNATGGGVYVELPRMVGLGYEQFGLIDWENIYNKTQQWKQSATLATYASGAISLINKEGNTFPINLTSDAQWITRTGYQAGSKIVIQNRNATTRKLFIDDDISSGTYNSTYDSGFSQLKFSGGLEDGDTRYWNLEQYDIAIFELVDSGTTRGIYWHLVWVSEMSRKLSTIFRPQPGVNQDAITEIENTYAPETDTKEVPLVAAGGSFPTLAFQSGNPDYIITGRITVRIKALVQIAETCIPFTTSTPDLTYLPNFSIVVTKNTTSPPTPALMATVGWGAVIVSAPICLDGSMSPIDWTPHFKTLNGSVIFDAKAADVFRVWLVSDREVIRVHTKALANDISQSIIFEPITRFLG